MWSQKSNHAKSYKFKLMVTVQHCVVVLCFNSAWSDFGDGLLWQNDIFFLKVILWVKDPHSIPSPYAKMPVNSCNCFANFRENVKHWYLNYSIYSKFSEKLLLKRSVSLTFSNQIKLFKNCIYCKQKVNFLWKSILLSVKRIFVFELEAELVIEKKKKKKLLKKITI